MYFFESFWIYWSKYNIIYGLIKDNFKSLIPYISLVNIYCKPYLNDWCTKTIIWLGNLILESDINIRVCKDKFEVDKYKSRDQYTDHNHICHICEWISIFIYY